VIEDIPKEFFRSFTFRYASQEDSIKVLLEMDLQPETIEEMLAFLMGPAQRGLPRIASGHTV
jgi:hypothetical protein